MPATLFWKSTCTTCREARGVILGLDATVTDRNYQKQPLTASGVREILAAAGSVPAVLNTRHAVAKEHGWKVKPPTADEFVAAVLQDSNVIRRPILLGAGRAVVGMHEADWRSVLSLGV